MYTALQVINLGLGKISSSRVERIDPPGTSLARYVADGYPTWKRTEIAKRRWVFATEHNYLCTRTETLDFGDRPYKFAMANDCLRPIRTKRSEWKQSGRFILSAYEELRIDYIRNATEAEFDPLFVEVLAWRIATECVEYVTQSNTKKADAINLYRDAVAEAGRANAYTIGAEDNTSDDDQYAFLTSRY